MCVCGLCLYVVCVFECVYVLVVVFVCVYCFAVFEGFMRIRFVLLFWLMSISFCCLPISCVCYSWCCLCASILFAVCVHVLCCLFVVFLCVYSLLCCLCFVLFYIYTGVSVLLCVSGLRTSICRCVFRCCLLPFLCLVIRFVV